MAISKIGSLVAVSCILGAASSAVAQYELNNTHWEGALVRSNSVQLVELDWRVTSGDTTALYSIPALGLFDQPVNNITCAYPVLTFEILYGTFAMHWDTADQEMTGSNMTLEPPIALHLKQSVKSQKRFSIEEVRYSSRAATIAGSLFVPTGEGPHAAIVIIHGSGAGTRTKWNYKFWGYFFARLGVAALIYDKRGEGESTGDGDKATFDDLAEDARAGVDYLATRGNIAPKRIGLFGSSQGGWLAPLAATKTTHASFLVINVAPAVSVAYQETDRVVYTLRSKGHSESAVALAKAYTDKMFEIAYRHGTMTELEPLLDSVKDQEWADLLTIVESEQDFEDWRLQEYDPANTLRKTKIPVLVTYGQDDHTVPPAENAELMEQYLKEAGNTDYKIEVIPNIGHNMFAGERLKNDTYAWPDSYWQWDKKSPRLLNLIRSWLIGHELTDE